jgi:hypothetical protein
MLSLNFFYRAVVIEEIVDDDKPTNGNGQLHRKKKNQSSDSRDHRESQQQIVVKNRGVSVLESEDEDGFPVSTTHKSNSNIQEPEGEAEQTEEKTTEKTKKKKKKAKDGDNATGLKRKVESVDQDDHQERCDGYTILCYRLCLLLIATFCCFCLSLFLLLSFVICSVLDAYGEIVT